MYCITKWTKAISNSGKEDVKMGAPIIFVRTYNWYGGDYYDVIYRSGRVVTMGVDDMPKTVRAFIKNAKMVRLEYDRIFKRVETIYE